MIVALLVLLGIPVWFVVGVAAAALWQRRQFVRAPGVFKCKVRVTTGNVEGVKDEWRQRPAYARWVHDVLLVRRGGALFRLVALPVAEVLSISQTESSVKGLGDAPQVASLRLDGEARVEVASMARDGRMLVGPGSVGQRLSAGR
jgi:hypothetical protein